MWRQDESHIFARRRQDKIRQDQGLIMSVAFDPLQLLIRKLGSLEMMHPWVVLELSYAIMASQIRFSAPMTFFFSSIRDVAKKKLPGRLGQAEVSPVPRLWMEPAMLLPTGTWYSTSVPVCLGSGAGLAGRVVANMSPTT